MAVIRYYAPNTSMGDSSDAYCELFRDFAYKKLRQEFPEHEIKVFSEDSSRECFVDLGADDGEDAWRLEENASQFCNELWTMANHENVGSELAE